MYVLYSFIKNSLYSNEQFKELQILCLDKTYFSKNKKWIWSIVLPWSNICTLNWQTDNICLYLHLRYLLQLVKKQYVRYWCKRDGESYNYCNEFLKLSHRLLILMTSLSVSREKKQKAGRHNLVHWPSNGCTHKFRSILYVWTVVTISYFSLFCKTYMHKRSSWK